MFEKRLCDLEREVIKKASARMRKLRGVCRQGHRMDYARQSLPKLRGHAGNAACVMVCPMGRSATDIDETFLGRRGFYQRGDRVYKTVIKVGGPMTKSPPALQRRHGFAL
jgi:hypothetical protein